MIRHLDKVNPADKGNWKIPPMMYQKLLEQKVERKVFFSYNLSPAQLREKVDYEV